MRAPARPDERRPRRPLGLDGRLLPTARRARILVPPRRLSEATARRIRIAPRADRAGDQGRYRAPLRPPVPLPPDRRGRRPGDEAPERRLASVLGNPERRRSGTTRSAPRAGSRSMTSQSRHRSQPRPSSVDGAGPPQGAPRLRISPQRRPVPIRLRRTLEAGRAGRPAVPGVAPYRARRARPARRDRFDPRDAGGIQWRRGRRSGSLCHGPCTHRSLVDARAGEGSLAPARRAGPPADTAPARRSYCPGPYPRAPNRTRFRVAVPIRAWSDHVPIITVSCRWIPRPTRW